jgi:hypothetical protein
MMCMIGHTVQCRLGHDWIREQGDLARVRDVVDNVDTIISVFITENRDTKEK